MSCCGRTQPRTEQNRIEGNKNQALMTPETEHYALTCTNDNPESIMSTMP